jgi:hypothetical protein
MTENIVSRTNLDRELTNRPTAPGDEWRRGVALALTDARDEIQDLINMVTLESTDHGSGTREHPGRTDIGAYYNGITVAIGLLAEVASTKFNIVGPHKGND